MGILIGHRILLIQSNQKKLLDYISSGAKKKMEKLLEAGLDPNFITEDGSKPFSVWTAYVRYTV